MCELLSQRLNAIQDRDDHGIARLGHEQPEVGQLKMLKHRLSVRGAETEVVPLVEAMIPRNQRPLVLDSILGL